MDLKLRPATLLGFSAYALVVLLPAIVATWQVAQPFDNGFAQYAATTSGVIAYAMISMQFVLAARFQWMVNPFGWSAVLRFHKTMAVVATLLVLVHVGLLVWSRGNWNLVLNPWAGWPIQLGRAAVFLILTILAFSFARPLIPINNSDFRWFHNALAWSILVSGFVHSMVMGSSFKNSSFAMIWIGYFAIAILAWLWQKHHRSTQ